MSERHQVVQLRRLTASDSGLALQPRPFSIRDEVVLTILWRESGTDAGVCI